MTVLKKYKILCAINAIYNGNNKTVAPSVVFPFNLKHNKIKTIDMVNQNIK